MSQVRSKIKHKYWEVRDDFSLVFTKADEIRKNEIFEHFSFLDDFAIIDKNLISFSFEELEKHAFVFWIRAEGNPNLPYAKRIELTKKSLVGFNCDEDLFLCVYKFEDNVTYASLKLSAESLSNFHDKNPTSIMKINTNELKSLEGKDYVHLKKEARRKEADLFMSKSLGTLLKITTFFQENRRVPPEVIWPSSNAHSTPGNAAEIGKAGEAAIDLLLSSRSSSDQKLLSIENKIGNKINSYFWNNRKLESFLPFDFLVNETCHLEVKASSVKNAKSFIVSTNEIEHFKRWNNYFLLFVTIDLGENPAKILSLRIFAKDELEKMEIIPRSYIFFPKI